MKEVAVEHQKAGADMKEVVHMKAVVPLAVDHQKAGPFFFAGSFAGASFSRGPYFFAGAEMKANQVVAFDTYFTQV